MVTYSEYILDYKNYIIFTFCWRKYKKVTFAQNIDFVILDNAVWPKKMRVVSSLRYSVSRPVETHMSGTTKNSAQHTKVNTAPNPLAKEELNLLARLMGGLEVQKPGNADSDFRLNLFANDEEEE